MFEIFMEEKIVTFLMAAFLAISIFLRVLLGLLYQNMIRETDNMSTTGNKLLKQCKLKFANCYQLNNGVSNIPVFVDRFLNRLAWGPFSFELLYHLSGQCILLSVISAGVGICHSIFRGKMLGEILPFYIVSFLGLYLYFSVSAIVDVKGRRQVLKVNLVDFLENHLSARMHATEENMDRLYGYANGTTGGAAGGRRLRVTAGSRASGRRTVELLPIDGGISNRFLQRERTETEELPAEEDSEPKSYSADSPESILNPEELETLLQEFFAT